MTDAEFRRFKRKLGEAHAALDEAESLMDGTDGPLESSERTFRGVHAGITLIERAEEAHREAGKQLKQELLEQGLRV